MSGIRFAFVFFILGCVAAVGWTSEKEEGTRAVDMAMASWLPQMCSAWNAGLERGDCGIDAVVNVAAASSVDMSGITAEAVWTKSEKSEPREVPFRRSDAVRAVEQNTKQ